MLVLCRWILVLSLLFVGGARLGAATPEDRAFDAAIKAFQDKFYARAEAELTDFCQKNPASPRLPDAVMVQAQARLELTNYAGAIELLAANQAKAGTNADQYLFWLGQAYLRKGDWRAASDAFAKLVKDQPSSTRCLEASVGEAWARSALAQSEPAEWQRVIGLFQDTNGVFQGAARTNAASELVPRGYLLLSEAQLATKDYRAAEATLQPLTNRLMSPRLGWQWQYLLCRIQLADGRTNAALLATTNLLAKAANGAQTNLLAESAAFRGSLLERMGQTNDAIVAYRMNLAGGTPAEWKLKALYKIIDLSLAQNNPASTAQAGQALETLLAEFPDAASADLALLNLGKLRLRQAEEGVGTTPTAPATTNAPQATNVLQLARERFDTLIKKFPQSQYYGEAQLGVGECFAKEGRLQEAEAAFRAAVDRLPPSGELATNYFRLADAQFQQTNFAGAIKSYRAIIEKFGALPGVRTNLFEPALDQSVRAGLAGGDLAAATNAMLNLLAWYPKSLSAASAVLLTAQDISRRGDPPTARKILLDFDQAAPDAPRRPERQMVAAATWEQEKNWVEAIKQYDAWLSSFTNHLDGFTNQLDQAQAEYHRAWDTSYTGQGTNALTLFTDFVVRFPTNESARLAQMWVADYFYNRGEYVEAERNYLLLSHSTNWPVSDLSYEAQLMAGSAAVRHQGWKEAGAYFTQLWNNTNGPKLDLRLQALFEYGDTLISYVDPSETNKLANWEEATRVFALICDTHPTNRLAALAWGRRGDCYMQWALARQQYDSLTNSLNAYQRVVDSPQADIAIRSKAKVGMAIALEKWAKQKTGAEQTALLNQALDHCADVVYGSKFLRKDELLDPFWTQKAAQEAFSLAEALQAWPKAASIYTRLTNSIWPLVDPAMLRGATNVFEHLQQEESNR